MREKPDRPRQDKKRLRKRAEEPLKEKSIEENQVKPSFQTEDHNLWKISKSAGVETERLIHELKVHQIELETQNEELRRIQLELEEAKNKYTELYNFAPVGYLAMNQKCTILEANFTACLMLNIEKQNLIKRNFSRYIHQEDSDVFYSYRKRLIDTGTRQVCELRMLTNDGTSFYAQLEGLASFDTGGDSVILK